MHYKEGNHASILCFFVSFDGTNRLTAAGMALSYTGNWVQIGRGACFV